MTKQVTFESHPGLGCMAAHLGNEAMAYPYHSPIDIGVRQLQEENRKLQEEVKSWETRFKKHYGVFKAIEGLDKQ